MNEEITTRGGVKGVITGRGPLSKRFLQVELENGLRYLVWESDRRYRMDDKDGKPVPSDLDII